MLRGDDVKLAEIKLLRSAGAITWQRCVLADGTRRPHLVLELCASASQQQLAHDADVAQLRRQVQRRVPQVVFVLYRHLLTPHEPGLKASQNVDSQGASTSNHV